MAQPAGRTQDGFECVVAEQAPDRARAAQELAAGLRAPQPSLPAWLLYDEAGSRLFDRICEAPEYYPTRTERALLERVAADVARRCRADELVELGAGMARKTHVLLEALGAGRRRVRYVPVDVSEAALREGAPALLRRHAGLRVRALVSDFRSCFHALGPPEGRRLVAFLGGTLGNFDPDEAVAFLRRVAGALGPQGRLLVGADLVKPRALLHAAYNDEAGLTASFNLNTLARLRREWGAHLDSEAFFHDAFFDEDASRIEMHARAARPVRVKVPSLGVERTLEAGRSIRTEISRKFTPASLEALLRASGLEPEALYVAPLPYALALARAAPRPG